MHRSRNNSHGRCFVAIALAGAALVFTGCSNGAAQTPAPSAWLTKTEAKSLTKHASLFSGGLHGKWQDFGWCKRDVSAGKPARLDLSQFGGWILAQHQTPGGQHLWAALRFQMKAPATHNDSLEVRLRRSDGSTIASAKLTTPDSTTELDGWRTYILSLPAVNPAKEPFAQLVFRAHREVPGEWVLIDNVEILTSNSIGSTTQPVVATRQVEAEVRCDAPGHTINPMIYGVAFNPQKATDKTVWSINPGARRWGGNPTSRYNWRLGNAWNTGVDWYYLNVNYTGQANFSWSTYLDQNRKNSVRTALTVPMLGWVAKDTRSVGFPVSIFGKQQSTDPYRPEAGNGLSLSGEKLTPQSPTQTSEPSSPDDIAAWVEAIVARDKKRGRRSVDMYILDNEPMLWHDTHRDVHPEPVSYDELWEKTRAYGQAIRRADPRAVIAGPAVWGWPAYHYSAVDAETSFRLAPDRRKHGNVPLLAWYLQKLRDHEKRTGERLLDVLDVHFYPQAKGMHTNGQGDRLDAQGSAIRLRSTRALWDPTYHDESWIDDTIELFPRLTRLIDENYPGLTFSIGEYNFGAESHISGALAIAEALGRFSAEPRLSAAFYWTYPPKNSPVAAAFRAYRNFDGSGAKFENRFVPVETSDPALSVFAARDDEGERLTLVALNLEPGSALGAKMRVRGCEQVVQTRAFRLGADDRKLKTVSAPKVSNRHLEHVLPPYSVTIYELTKAQ